MIIKCPECGHQVSDRAKTCPSCGIEIAGMITRCPDCGEYIFKYEHECPNCHCAISPSVASVQESSMPVSVSHGEGRQLTDSPEVAVKKGHKVLWSSLIVGFVIALTIVLLGIYFYQKSQQENELRAYENAMMSKEPAVLQNFLDMYVEAPMHHRDSVKVHLEALKKIDRDWQNAVASQSRSALRLFIERNPENVHVAEARLIIDSLDFVSAQLVNTMEAYQTYMNTHQDGGYYDEAAIAYDRLREAADAKLRQAELDSIQAARNAAAVQNQAAE